MSRARDFLFLILAWGLSGCAGENRHPFDSVAKNVGERTGARVVMERSAETESAVGALLGKPLSAESCVQVALLNNRKLAAEFEGIGIAEAEFRTAGQIRNPTFGVDARLPDKPPRGTDVEMSLMFDVVDLFLVPVRKRIAANQLDQATLRAGDDALEIVHQARVAFYRCTGQQQIVEIQREMTSTVVTAESFAERQHAAGNISDLALSQRQAEAAQAKLDLIGAEAELARDREAVNAAMGLGESQLNWTIGGELSSAPKEEGELMDRRIDLEIAHQQVALAEEGLKLTKMGVLTDVSVGVSSERQTEGQTIVGPAISLEVPIFNQHQGQIARAEAEMRLAKKNLEAMEVKAQSEGRLAKENLKAAREAAELASGTLLPARVKAVALTQQEYNGMLAGQYSLLEAKRDELAARREVVELNRDYWIARAELQRVTGN